MTIQQASQLVGRSLGFPETFDGSPAAVNALETDSKLALTAGLGAYIRAHPQEFSAQQNSVASSMSGLSGQPLADAGFSIADFVTATEANAEAVIGAPLVAVGQSFSYLIGLIPLVTVGVVGFLIFSQLKKTTS